MDDARVRGLVVHAYAPTLSLVHAEELRAAVEAFPASGKPTVAWAESFGELTSGSAGYVVATACEHIWLQPSGDLGLVGAAAETVFLREALDKIDVLPQIGQRHEFKSAADTFMQRELTPPHATMLQAIVSSAVDVVVETVAHGRGLQADAVRAAVDEAPLPAARAVELGLVDELGYRDDAYASVRERIGDPTGEQVDLRYVDRYKALHGLEELRHRGRPVIAVVQADGPIHLGRSGASPLAGRSVGSDSIGAALREAGRDEKIAAVVLRIDSPGGSYVASDAIRREVLRLRERGMPVVASMGAAAASGGYFIAMPCDEIVAGAATLTGSIGVLAGKNVIQGGLDRLGVHRALVTQGRRAGMFSSTRPFTQEEQAHLDAWLDTVYADFTAKAARDRDMPLEDLEPHARGRVWTGADAQDLGLVDRLGGLADAIELAADLVGIARDNAEARIVPKAGVLDRLMPADNSDSPIGAQSCLFAEQGLLQQVLLTLAPTGVLTMPPIRL